MTETTTAESELETRARAMYEDKREDDTAWGDLPATTREFWRRSAVINVQSLEQLPQLVDRARELYDHSMVDSDAYVRFDSLTDDEREAWITRARETAPTARRQARRGLNLEILGPIARETVAETGIDPRTHHKSEHRELALEWSSQTKALKLLARPGEEDLAIRKDLQERGFSVYTTDLSTIPPVLNPVIE